MSTLTETGPLQTDAARAAYTQWRKAVEDELQGAPFDKKLVTRTVEGISLLPVYTRNDVAGLADTAAAPGHAPFGRATKAAGYAEGAWEFAQQIDAARASDFNAAVLDALNRGQNSVALPLDRAGRGGADPDGAEKDVGVDGVSIADLPDLAAALEDVAVDCIPVHLDAGVSPFAAAALYVAEAKKKGVDLKKLTGSLTADPLGEWAVRGHLPVALDTLFDQLAGWTDWAKKNAPALTTVGVNSAFVLEAGGNAVQELAYAIAAGVETARALLRRGVTAHVVFPRIRFTFAVGPQFFTEVAKFRAFRLLWARAATALGAKPGDARPVVHARTARWNTSALDLHVNMLRTTTEALSAVLGGIDSLHIAPFDEVLGKSDEFSRRIARNLHTILAEEFRFTSPADPSGGSWYVEKLTDELARKAWTLFQEIEGKGGCSVALSDGSFHRQVATAAAEKDDAVGKRRLGLVGTNLFPNAKEKLAEIKGLDAAIVAARKTEIASRRPGAAHRHEAKDWPTVFYSAVEAAEHGATVGQLSRWWTSPSEAPITPFVARRASEGFEALRRVSENLTKSLGARPKVFVAKMGPVAQHKARADFTAGFFAVGGFEMLAKQSFDTAEAAAKAAIDSGAPVAVLCSTDDTYPALAPVFAKAIKASKPSVTVVLAGYPAEHVEAFRAAGFDEFIHIRANVRELLAKILTKIGASI